MMHRTCNVLTLSAGGMLATSSTMVLPVHSSRFDMVLRLVVHASLPAAVLGQLHPTDAAEAGLTQLISRTCAAACMEGGGLKPPAF